MKAGSSTDWMSSGGAYWILAVEIFISAAFYAGAGIYLGKITRHENDGCILSIVNIFAAICGGAIGFWFAHYPFFVVTTLAGTLIAPLLVSLMAARRFRQGH